MRRKYSLGFTLTEILIALIVIAIIAGVIYAGYREVISSSYSTSLQKDIVAIREAYNAIALKPYCQIPTDKTSFINEVSDSQCRPNTTDGKGTFASILQYKDKLIGKFPWDIDFTQKVLKISDVPPDIAKDINLSYCTYDANTQTLLCSLTSNLPPSSS